MTASLNKTLMYSPANMRWIILTINQLVALISQIYFWYRNLHVSDSSSVHHQEFFTVHTAMVYIIQLASRIRTELQFCPDSARCQAVSKPVWHIPFTCVQWKTPDDGQRNCPKHVDFYSKNKFQKLVHLVGFIIRTYYGARWPEIQMCWIRKRE